MKLHLIIYLICFSVSVQAQKAGNKGKILKTSVTPSQPPKVDTLELARTKAYAKHFAEADKLLSAYNAAHRDLNGLRLQAQVLVWAGENEKASDVYEKTISQFPQVDVVKLDYGRLLFQLYSFSKAKTRLNDYLIHDPKNAEANLLLAYIDNQEGKTQQANKRTNDLLKWYRDYADAAGLLQQINYKTALTATVGGGYTKDDQPLTDYKYDVGLSKYYSWLLFPELKANLNSFSLSDSSYHPLSVEVGNTVSLYNAGVSFSFGGGFFNSGISGLGSSFIGHADISKKLSNQFSLSAGIEKKPYQYTLAAISQGTTFTTSSAALSFHKNDKWLGKAGYQIQQFQDDNKIATAYAWLLAPIVSQNVFSVKAGYSFNYANSDKNSYTHLKTAEELVSTNTYNQAIEGVYNPYFSPARQTVHSGLAVVNISGKKVSFSAKAAVGFSAKLDVPYLYLNTDSTTGKLTFTKEFQQQSYTPIEISSDLKFALSPKLSLIASYTYSKVYFYTSNNLFLHLKYAFFK